MPYKMNHFVNLLADYEKIVFDNIDEFTSSMFPYEIDEVISIRFTSSIIEIIFLPAGSGQHCVTSVSFSKFKDFIRSIELNRLADERKQELKEVFIPQFTIVSQTRYDQP